MYRILWDQIKSRSYKKIKATDAANVLRNCFVRHKILEAKESAIYIVGHVIYKKPIIHYYKLIGHYLDLQQVKMLKKLFKQRLLRMPIQYIIGQWYFYNDDILLEMKQPIFIPRPETVHLIDIAVENIKHMTENNKMTSKCNILEIGCGSGAICLSILKSFPVEFRQKYLSCIAVDKQLKAVELTRQNAKKLNVELFVLHNNITNLEISTLNTKVFDIIVSNPPYLCTSEIDHLQDEVKRYEDHTSLIGGEDGLDVIKDILYYSEKVLKLGGILLMEVALTHPQNIANILNVKFPHLRLKYIHKDFTERDRFVEIIKIKS